MSSGPTLYIVDASAFIFKSFHGLRERLSTADGEPVQAVFGYMRTLLRILRIKSPSHIAVAFDSKGPTFRTKIYPDYKANRPPPPPSLPEQYELCVAGTQSLGLKNFSVKELEADDIIGTLVKAWVKQTSGRCVIIGTDKDMMQLISDQVTMWDGLDKESGLDQVIEKFGVRADQVIDLLGLAGDTSDNIPGVPGIGVKTAAKLLNEYETMEGVLSHADQVKGKRGESLKQYGDQARLSAELATIACEADLGEVIDDLQSLCHFNGPSFNQIEPFFDQLGFARLKMDLLKRWPRSEELIATTNEVVPKQDSGEPLVSIDQTKKEIETDAGHSIPLQVVVDRNKYECITKESALIEAINQIKKAGVLSIDLETTSLKIHQAEILGVALAWGENQAAYVPIDHFYLGMPTQLSLEQVKDHLGPLLLDSKLPKVCQNHKYDRKVLAAHDIPSEGWEGDPMLMAHLLDPTRLSFGLDALCQWLFDHTNLTFKQVAGAKGADDRFRLVTVERATEYAAEDADMTLRLYHYFKPQIEANEALKILYYDVELPLNSVLAEMEQTGIRLDCQQLQSQSKEMLIKLLSLSEDIQALAGEKFNIDSPKQLSYILFDKLGLEAKGMKKKTSTGQKSTRHDILEKMKSQHPIIEKILNYRHFAKLRSTYLEALPSLIEPKTQRLHTSFSQIGTATGRLSSTDPNLQNIPLRTPEGKRIREAFITEEGWQLISADYSQVELRLLAHFAEATTLIEGFNQGIDIHAATASEIFGIPPDELTSDQRRGAKAINFGLMYGMGAKRLSESIGVSFKEAKTMVNTYFEKYGEVRAYFSKAVAEAELYEETKTLMGRRRPLKEINAKGARKAQAERLAVNTPIQGTAADILKVAMVKLHRAIKDKQLQARMLLTVHDELVIEAPDHEVEEVVALTRECMESAVQLTVPLAVEVGVGTNWAEIH
jgi:DNA polymerase I